MGRPGDINHDRLSFDAARRVLVAIEAEDAGGAGHAKSALPIVDGYTIDRELGAGAGGVTYLAHKRGSEARVALKILRANLGEGAASQRAWRELDMLQQLRAPSVPRLLDFGTVNGSLYVATEFIDGSPLDRLHDKAAPTGGTELRDRVRLLERIARAAHTLHEHGVIHRDLKPSNVMVTPSTPDGGGGEPFIIDLGIALIDAPDPHHTLTQDGQPIGTPAFMAPEQARGQRAEISTRSDIYSLGAIGYWLCVGQTPHDLSGVTLHEAIRRVGSEVPREAREVSKHVPKGLGAVLGKACAAKAADRYGSAVELAEDLGRWTQGQPVQAARPPSWLRAARWIESHPVLATTCGCLLIALGIVGGTAGVLAYINQRPFAAVISEDERFATLRAVSGQPLQQWDAGSDCRIPFAQLLTPKQSARPGGLVVVQLPVAEGNDAAGYRMTTFDPSNPAVPLWSTPTLLEAPASTPDVSAEFRPGQALVAEVFEENLGMEVIQTYEHPTAYQSAIMIYSLDGALLHQSWHWGPIGDLVWVQDDRVLMVLAEDWERPWAELGVQDALYYPLVLFALHPRLNYSATWLSGPMREPTADLAWYRCVKPPELVEQHSPLLRLCTNAIHPDGLIDLEWTNRDHGTLHTTTISQDGWIIKNWNRRDFGYSSNADAGPNVRLGYLPRSEAEHTGLILISDSTESRFETGSQSPSLPLPIAHWTFDDPEAIGRDITGNGHDLLIPFACEPVPGPADGAARFEAGPARARANHTDSPLGPSCSTDSLVYPGPFGFAVAAWFRIDAKTQHLVIQDFEQHTSCGSVFSLAYAPETHYLAFQVSHEVSTPIGLSTLIPTSLPERWIHVVGVYEPSPLPVIRLYIDGVEKMAKRLEGPMRSFERPSRFYVSGSWHSTTGSTVDDIRIYDVPLSPSAVQMLYGTTMNP